ncbi:MAG: hypothetical protein Ct9H300mP23_04850 [Nitrospinota bacterium]|nr:MAG: hypothetical protein Ct9H300mP23_04850 [Nitrospinota bacterium]
MRQSPSIIQQVLEDLPGGPYKDPDNKVSFQPAKRFIPVWKL